MVNFLAIRVRISLFASQKAMRNLEKLDIDRIAFIGRTFDEYKNIFALDDADLGSGPILDCPAGPSSFSAEAARKGLQVTACDMTYQLSIAFLGEKGKKDIEHVFDRVNDVPHLYVWNTYKNWDEIVSLRRKALGMFQDDFPKGYGEGRYVHGELPRLPFPDKAFSLVLSAHFLFLYGDRLDVEFHRASLREMARVCSGELRIYPLQGLDAKPYPHLADVLDRLRCDGIESKIIDTTFELQRGANRMLSLKDMKQ